MVFHRLTVILSALVITGISASAIAADRLPASCIVTAESFSSDREPAIFYKTNNLRRNIGSAITAEGERIVIKGRVTDERCVPISDATIELWQADHRGDYAFAGKGRATKNGFSGSGTAVTDNLGRFEFITILPEPSQKQAQHVNLRVRHANFLEFQTIATFGGASKGRAVLIADGYSELGNVYNVLMTLPGKNQYRTY